MDAYISTYIKKLFKNVDDMECFLTYCKNFRFPVCKSQSISLWPKKHVTFGNFSAAERQEKNVTAVSALLVINVYRNHEMYEIF